MLLLKFSFCTSLLHIGERTIGERPGKSSSGSLLAVEIVCRPERLSNLSSWLTLEDPHASSSHTCASSDFLSDAVESLRRQSRMIDMRARKVIRRIYFQIVTKIHRHLFIASSVILRTILSTDFDVMVSYPEVNSCRDTIIVSANLCSYLSDWAEFIVISSCNPFLGS